jgi:hypothetical protein
MNIDTNLEVVANNFSSAVLNLSKTSSKDEDVNNRIQSLSAQIMQCATNFRESPLVRCRSIIDKASQVSNMTSSLENNADLNARLATLIHISEEVIIDSLINNQSDVSFVVDFFSFNNMVQNALLENPQIKERLVNTIHDTGPLFDLTSIDKATLFIKLASDPNPKISAVAKEICPMIIKKFIKKKDVEGLRLVLNSGYFPFEPIKHTDFFSAIEANETFALALEKELKTAKNTFTKETLEAYRNLAKNLDNPNNTRRSIKMDSIDRDFLILVENKIPGAAEAKAKFDASSETRLQRENMAKAHAILNESSSPEEKVQAALKISKNILLLLKEIAWMNNDNKLLSECQKFIHPFTEEKVVNKIIANIALDKMYFPEKDSYKGGINNWVAPYFANALEIASSKLEEIKPNFEKAIPPTQQLLNQICLELHQSTRWECDIHSRSLQEATGEKNRFLQSNDLISTINSLPKGMSILIPISAADHATLMRVENTGEGTCRILYHNTGDGIDKHHPKGQKTNTYQTFIEYAQVPLQNFQDPNTWSTLINKEIPDMSLVYTLLDKLCSGGTKQPPSPYPEFYEAMQASGSCAYQCILSMIRERIVSSMSNPEEGLALYKIVKGTLHEGLEEKTRPLRNAAINSVFLSKLHIMGLEIEIARALSDPSQRTKLIDEVCEELRANGLEDLEEKIKNYAEKTPLALFTVFREVLSELEKTNNPLIGNGLVTKILQASKERDSLNRQSYLEVLDSYLQDPTSDNIKACVASLGSSFVGGKLQTAAGEWMITRLVKVPAANNKDPSTFILGGLVIAFNTLPQETRKELLPLLLYMYSQAKNNEMVAYLQSACSVE